MATPAPTRSAGAGPCWLRAESRRIHHPKLQRRGPGIGLSVVCLLIEAMGARVQVAAHPGGGPDVQLLLPGVRARADVPTRENTEAVAGSTGIL